MATTLINFDGGTNGSGATAALTGAAIASAGAGGSLIFDSGSALNGPVGLKGVAGVGAINDVEYHATGYAGATGTVTFATATTMEFRIPYWLSPTAPSVADTSIFTLYGSAGAAPTTTAIMRIRVGLLGQLTVSDVATVHVGTINADVTALFGTWITLHGLINTGTTTTDGSLRVRLLNAANALVGTEFISVAPWNFGAGGLVSAFRLGVLTNQTTTGREWRTDYVQVNSASTAYSLLAPVSGTPPVANAGIDLYVQSGAAATVTVSASASTGAAPLTYQWGPAFTEIPAGAPTPSLATPTSVGTTFIAARPGRYVLPVTVTQSGGLTNTDSITIWAHPPSGVDVPVYGVDGTTTWTNEGGATNLTAALNDATTLTKAQSPAAPVAARLPLIMCPFGNGTVDNLVEGNWSGAAVTRTATWLKEDGVTVLYTETWALTAVEVEHLVSMGSSGLTSIPLDSDRRALRFYIDDTAV
jgi:hypothetical protein